MWAGGLGGTTGGTADSLELLNLPVAAVAGDSGNPLSQITDMNASWMGMAERLGLMNRRLEGLGLEPLDDLGRKMGRRHRAE